MFNEFQQKVFDYLTVPNHPDRTRALAIMMQNIVPYRGGIKFFDYAGTTEDAPERLKAWLNWWRVNDTFCEDGLERAEKALLAIPSVEVIVRLKIELQPHDATTANKMLSARRHFHFHDYGTMALIQTTLEGAEGGNDEFSHKIVRAKWIDYEINP